jgi:Pyruvate/2-oxoacid:ferredoxin oxidoreductase gamma subunit
VLKSLFLTGLGGQGVLTISKILGSAASEKGLEVTIFNAKGMAQRGGRVTSEIRMCDEPERVFGSRIAAGCADILIGLEIGEALNSIHYIKSGGTVILLDYTFLSPPTILKKEPYPTASQVAGCFSEKTTSVYLLSEPQHPYNMFVLGFFAALLEEDPKLVEGVEPAAIEASILKNLRREVDKNIEVFHTGMALEKASAAG